MATNRCGRRESLMVVIGPSRAAGMGLVVGLSMDRQASVIRCLRLADGLADGFPW